MQPSDFIDIQLDREDIILLLLDANQRILRNDTINGITRMEKLLFLLERESNFQGVARFFPFEPHHFGPFSKEVYEAIDFLESCRLIDVREKSYSTLYANSDESKLWSEIMESDVPVELQTGDAPVTEKLFSLTDDGRVVAGKLRDAVAARRPSDIQELDDLIRRYGNRPLSHLIRYVYHQYPQMTVKSKHPEAKRVRRSF